MENFGDSGRVAGEVAFCSFGDTTPAPRDQDALGESRIGVLDLDEGELDPAFVEVFYQLVQLAICNWSVSRRLPWERAFVPPVPSTLRMLSLAPLSWKAFMSGACTEKSAHWA